MSKEHLGFSRKEGVDWAKYAKYRPVSPLSFFARICDYHEQKADANWSLAHDVGAGAGIASKVGGSEVVEWVENDVAWSYSKDLQWFKNYISTWVPTVSEDEISDIWQAMEEALAGEKVMIEFPVALILATKKA